MFEIRKPYITVSKGMTGYSAVYLIWNEKDEIYEPIQLGANSYAQERDAINEAKDWALETSTDFRYP